MVNINDRIAVVKELDEINHICYLYGYGKFLGNVVPSKNCKYKEGRELYKTKTQSSKLLLDDKRVFWFFNAWFMEEDKFKELFIEQEKWEIIEVKGSSK